MQASFYRIISMIYYAVLAGLVMIGAVFFMLHDKNAVQVPVASAMIYVAAALSVFGFAGSYFIQNKRMQGIQSLTTDNKYGVWKSTFIMRIALMEMPCLFCLVNYFVSGQNIFLYIFIALFCIMVINIP